VPPQDRAVLLDTEHAVARVAAGGADPPQVYGRLLEYRRRGHDAARAPAVSFRLTTTAGPPTR
jgi:hypothetical protein